MPEVVVDGLRYVPRDDEEASELADRIRTFTLEGSTHWREQFMENDIGYNGKPMGMYGEGDEEAPFFSEAFLYNLLGKDEARSVLGIMRRLCKLAGVEYR